MKILKYIKIIDINNIIIFNQQLIIYKSLETNKFNNKNNKNN